MCAAIIRVFGSSMAEMPLVATRRDARRQGHCRVLMNVVEVSGAAAAASQTCKNQGFCSKDLEGGGA